MESAHAHSQHQHQQQRVRMGLASSANGGVVAAHREEEEDFALPPIVSPAAGPQPQHHRGHTASDSPPPPGQARDTALKGADAGVPHAFPPAASQHQHEHQHQQSGRAGSPSTPFSSAGGARRRVRMGLAGAPPAEQPLPPQGSPMMWSPAVGDSSVPHMTASAPDAAAGLAFAGPAAVLLPGAAATAADPPGVQQRAEEGASGGLGSSTVAGPRFQGGEGDAGAGAGPQHQAGDALPPPSSAQHADGVDGAQRQHAAAAPSLAPSSAATSTSGAGAAQAAHLSSTTSTTSASTPPPAPPTAAPAAPDPIPSRRSSAPPPHQAHVDQGPPQAQHPAAAPAPASSSAADAAAVVGVQGGGGPRPQGAGAAGLGGGGLAGAAHAAARAQQQAEDAGAAAKLAPRASAPSTSTAAPPTQPRAAAAATAATTNAATTNAAAAQPPQVAHAQRAEEHKQRGNNLYAQQRYQQAEEAYSQALEALGQARPTRTELAVLHSNRAGARLMVGRPQAALEDAQRAVALDPAFHRAVSRAATCHCRMGDFDSAQRVLDQALAQLSPSSPHRQELASKLEEVRRTRQDLRAVAQDLMQGLGLGPGHAATAGGTGGAGGAREGAGSAGPAATQLASTASGGPAAAGADQVQAALSRLEALLPQVVFSEGAACMRAVALLALGRWERARQACGVQYQAPAAVVAAPWRTWVGLQACYLGGNLEKAGQLGASLAEALRAPAAGGEREARARELRSLGGDSAAVLRAVGLRLPSLSEALAAAQHAQQLQRLKEEGNAAVKSKQHGVAVERYTAALALAPPPAVAAVLHGNRAAAHQGAGSLLEAVADACRARALDPTYLRALTRLAALLLELRRAGAAKDLLELPSASNPSANPRGDPSGANAPSLGAATEAERQQVASQLAAAREAAKWQVTPDHFALLGLDQRACGDDEVKKAYRMAALRHHPDKAAAACRFGTALPTSAPPHASGDAPGAAPGEEQQQQEGGPQEEEGGEEAGGEDGDAAVVVPVVADMAGGVEGRLKEEAAWLFSLIGQANEALGDATRRAALTTQLEAEAAPPSTTSTAHAALHAASFSHAPWGGGGGGSFQGGWSFAGRSASGVSASGASTSSAPDGGAFHHGYGSSKSQGFGSSFGAAYTRSAAQVESAKEAASRAAQQRASALGAAARAGDGPMSRHQRTGSHSGTAGPLNYAAPGLQRAGSGGNSSAAAAGSKATAASTKPSVGAAFPAARIP